MKVEVVNLSKFPWAARQEQARFYEGSVPIAELSIFQLSGGPSVPVCLLDTQSFPKVATAIQARRGELAERPTFGYSLDCLATGDDVSFAFLFRIGRHSWSRMRFKVIFSASLHRAWLQEAALSNQVTLIDRCVNTAGEALDSGITWPIDGVDLAHALRLADEASKKLAANSR